MKNIFWGLCASVFFLSAAHAQHSNPNNHKNADEKTEIVPAKQVLLAQARLACQGDRENGKVIGMNACALARLLEKACEKEGYRVPAGYVSIWARENLDPRDKPKTKNTSGLETAAALGRTFVGFDEDLTQKPDSLFSSLVRPGKLRDQYRYTPDHKDSHLSVMLNGGAQLDYRFQTKRENGKLGTGKKYSQNFLNPKLIKALEKEEMSGDRSNHDLVLDSITLRYKDGNNNHEVNLCR